MKTVITEKQVIKKPGVYVNNRSSKGAKMAVSREAKGHVFAESGTEAPESWGAARGVHMSWVPGLHRG